MNNNLSREELAEQVQMLQSGVEDAMIWADESPEQLAEAQAVYNQTREQYQKLYGGGGGDPAAPQAGLTGGEIAQFAVPLVAGAIAGPPAAAATRGLLAGAPAIVRGTGVVLGEAVATGAAEGVAEGVVQRARGSTLEEAVETANARGGEAAMFQAILGGLLKTAGTAYTGVFGKGNKSKDVQDVQNFLKDVDGTSTARLETNSRLFTIVENFAENAWLASGLKQARKNNYQAIKKAIPNLTRNIVGDMDNMLTDDAVGHLVKDLLNNQSDVYRGVASNLYKEIDSVTAVLPPRVIQEQIKVGTNAGGGPIYKTMVKEIPNNSNSVSLIGFKARAAKKLKALEGSKNVGGGEDIAELRKIASMDDYVSFEAADAIKRKLSSKGNRAGANADTELAGFYRSYSGDMSKALDETAERIGGDTLKKYKNVKSFVAGNKGIFENSLVVQMANKNPSAIAKEIFKNPDTAEALFKDLNRYKQVTKMKGKEGVERLSDEVIDNLAGNLKSKYLNQVLYKGADEGNKIFSLTGMEKMLFNEGDDTYKVLRKAFSSNQIDDFKSLYDNVSRIQGKEKGLGEFTLNVQQGGLIMALLSQGTTLSVDATKAAVSLMGIPAITSFAMSNPQALKMFKSASRLIVNGKTAAASKLMARGLYMAEQDYLEDVQREKIKQREKQASIEMTAAEQAAAANN